MKRFQAILFDMDGTLIDTEKYYRECWPRAAADCGYSMTDEQALELRSLGRPFAIDRFREMYGDERAYGIIKARRLELVKEKIAKEGIASKPYAAQALKRLKDQGYCLAVTTATDMERTREYLDRVGLRDYFDDLICATMVKQGKPAPDVYLYACERLGIRPKEALAVEDAPNGILSAYRAGCAVAMIPDQTQPDKELASLLYVRKVHLLELAEFLCGPD